LKAPTLTAPVITFSAITNTGYTMSWAATGAAFYYIARTGNSAIDIAYNITNATSVVVTGLQAGTTYNPVVSSTFDGKTQLTTIKSVTTTDVAPTVPVITVANGGAYGFNASWACVGASSYLIDLKDNLGNEISGTTIQPSVAAIDFNTQNNQFSIQPLTKYTLTVTAYSPTNKTSSASVSYLTPSLAPMVTSLSCVRSASNCLTFSWNQTNSDSITLNLQDSTGTLVYTGKVNPNFTTVEIVNLNSDSYYICTVIGVSGLGKNQMSCVGVTGSNAAGNSVMIDNGQINSTPGTNPVVVVGSHQSIVLGGSQPNQAPVTLIFRV